MRYPNRNVTTDPSRNYLIDPNSLPSDRFKDFDLSCDMDTIMGDSKWWRNRTRTPKEIRSAKLAYDVYPDFEVELADDEPEYIDVKFESALEEKEERERVERTREYLASKGIRYRVVTDTQIRRSVLLLEHLKFFKAWRARSVYSVGELQKELPKQPITFGELEKQVGSKIKVIEMIAHQLVFCDLAQPISTETILRPIGDQDHALMY